MQTQPSIGILFISGAGLGTWIWKDVADQLPNSSVVIDFESLKKTSKNARLSAYADEALTQAQALNTEQIIVVAHSAGGVIGEEVASRLGEKLAGFVAISAALPEKGAPFLSVLPFPQNIITRVILKLAGTKPPESAIKAGLCNDLDNALASRIVSSFSPESIHLYTDPVSAGAPTVQSTYVFTSTDAEFPLSLQQKMAQRLDSPTIIQLDTGHLPMLTNPKAISAAVTALIKG